MHVWNSGAAFSFLQYCFQSGDCNQQLCAAVSDLLSVCKLVFCEKEMSSFRERKSAYLHPVPGPQSTHQAPITEFHDRVLMSLLCNMKANICLLNIDLQSVHMHVCSMHLILCSVLFL